MAIPVQIHKGLNGSSNDTDANPTLCREWNKILLPLDSTIQRSCGGFHGLTCFFLLFALCRRREVLSGTGPTSNLPFLPIDTVTVISGRVYLPLFDPNSSIESILSKHQIGQQDIVLTALRSHPPATCLALILFYA